MIVGMAVEIILVLKWQLKLFYRISFLSTLKENATCVRREYIHILFEIFQVNLRPLYHSAHQDCRLLIHVVAICIIRILNNSTFNINRTNCLCLYISTQLPKLNFTTLNVKIYF